MKKYFSVSFQHSENVYCANIAHAETAEEVEAHYSKYAWYSVREAQDHEVETAKRKGMPIIEIESKEDESMKFELIAEQVKEDAEQRKRDTAEIIEKGYLSTWSTEHHEQNDNGLKRESTATRWEQYTSGKITRAEAVELATKRAYKAIDKDTAEKLAKLERVANAPDLDYISICVEWKRSATWGMNPTAYVNTNSERTSGHASGCGYDKESAAIAQALNQCDSVLKALYSFKEKQMREGQNDHSRTACTGHDNRHIIGYGAGYATIPYFEGGVGASCFWSIFERIGYTCRGDHSGRHSTYYHIGKKTA